MPVKICQRNVREERNALVTRAEKLYGFVFRELYFGVFRMLLPVSILRRRINRVR